MKEGDVVKYMPTATVGKVTETKEENGRVWVKLDKTGLFYAQETLQACDASEYKTSSFKEREGSRSGFKIDSQDVSDLNKMEEDVDIGNMNAGGAG